MLLLNFTFGNYASFKDEQLFTMERSGKMRSGMTWPHAGVSSVAAVYGANASGKSRFLRAMWFVARFVSGSFARGDRGKPIDVSAFLLDKDSRSKPSSFLIDFIADDGLRYKYWFTVTQEEVRDEVLQVYRSNRPSLLFSRREGNDGEQAIEFGGSFKGAKRAIWDITRRNSLFLSSAAVAGNDTVASAYSALTRGVGFYDAPEYGTEISSIKREAEEGDEAFGLLQRLIQYADFGVTGLRLQERDVNDALSSSFAEAIASNLDGEEGEKFRSSFMKELKTELAFQHKGESVLEWFPSSMESDGTVAALSFLSVALRALSKGSVVLVDEIDKSLHPWLVREFVSLFTDPATNPLQAQLIFTTHDESLIDESGEDRLLSRDQIWLTEKDDAGRSELVAVTEYSPHPHDNIGYKYIRGVYGAVPMLTLHSQVARAVEELDLSAGSAGRQVQQVADGA